MHNKIRDAFELVHAEDALKARTSAYLAQSIRARAEKKPSDTRRLAPVFACFALALLGLGGWRFYMTPVSAISVDVNPSVEIGVNSFDRVVSVDGYNGDGNALAASVDLANLRYTQALDVLLSSAAMQPYLENDGLVSITVIGRTEAKSKEMQQRIAACQYANRPNVQCQCGRREEVTAAHDAGLSFGKYRVFLELQTLDPTITVEDIRGWTMRQLRDRIQELSGLQSNTRRENGAGEFGKGLGGGHHGGN